MRKRRPAKQRRVGKIARCPAAIRDEINRRLYDGERGLDIVTWLHEQPSVQSMLASVFNGTRINEKNLSKWRLGGFRDWLRLIEAAEIEKFLRQESAGQGKPANGMSPSE